jgi:hypothetical protein
MNSDSPANPPQSPSSLENKVPLQPARPAPGAEEKHERIDKAIEKIDHKTDDAL